MESVGNVKVCLRKENTLFSDIIKNERGNMSSAISKTFIKLYFSVNYQFYTNQLTGTQPEA